MNKIGLSSTGIPGKLNVYSNPFNSPISNLFYELKERFGRLSNNFTPKEWC